MGNWRASTPWREFQLTHAAGEFRPLDVPSKEARYLVALCSDGNLPSTGDSTLIDISGRLLVNLREQIVSGGRALETLQAQMADRQTFEKFNVTLEQLRKEQIESRELARTSLESAESIRAEVAQQSESFSSALADLRTETTKRAEALGESMACLELGIDDVRRSIASQNGLISGPSGIQTALVRVQEQLASIENGWKTGAPASHATPAQPKMEEHQAYLGMISRLRDLIKTAIPAKARVLVVSKGDNMLLELDDRKARHFPQVPAVAMQGITRRIARRRSRIWKRCAKTVKNISFFQRRPFGG